MGKDRGASKAMSRFSSAISISGNFSISLLNRPSEIEMFS